MNPTVNQSPPKKQFVNISLTWTGVCKFILAALSHGTREGKQEAEAALYEMAAVADQLKEFPNGIESWKSVLFDVTISLGRSVSRPKSMAESVYLQSGYDGLRNLAIELASRFEELHKGVNWVSVQSRGIKMQFFMLESENDYWAERQKDYLWGEYFQDQS